MSPNLHLLPLPSRTSRYFRVPFALMNLMSFWHKSREHSSGRWMDWRLLEVKVGEVPPAFSLPPCLALQR